MAFDRGTAALIASRRKAAAEQIDVRTGALLGDAESYLHEVDDEIQSLNRDLGDFRGTTLPSSFTGTWPPFLAEWHAFRSSQGALSKTFNSTELMARTRQFEDRLIGFYDQAAAGGVKVSARPVPGYQEAESTIGGFKTRNLLIFGGALLVLGVGGYFLVQTRKTAQMLSGDE